MNLISTGRSHLTEGMLGLKKTADLARQREQTEANMDKADKAQKISNISTGAGMGYMIGSGASVGGPWGAAIGAGIGLLASDLF